MRRGEHSEPMAPTDIDTVKAQFVGQEFDHSTFTADAERMVTWAEACGETDPRFCDPDHPDFQAHPTFTSHFTAGRMLPDGFPNFGGRGFDGGKTVEIHAPVRPGDELAAVTSIADVYTKTGRSGTMTFIVQRMRFTNQRGEPVATVDWRMVRGGGPGA